MKLHLPKSLLASIVLAFVVFPVYAETGIDGTQIPESGDVVEEGEPEPMRIIDLEKKESLVGDGKSFHYEVGTQTEKAQDSVTWWSSLDLFNKDTIGYWDGSLKTSGFGSYYEGTKNGAYTNSVNIYGNLTLNGESQVALGGQYREKIIVMGVTLGTVDYYSGIIAKKVSVNDTATLISDRVNFESLSASGMSTVNLHTNQRGGSSASAKSEIEKQTYISGKIAVSERAQVTMGVDNGQNDDDKPYDGQFLNRLGGEITQDSFAKVVNSLTGEVEQKESSLLIKGRTYIKDALNIVQSGGNMEIALQHKDSVGSSYLRLGKESGNSIKQTTGGTMKIGQIISGNNGNGKSQISIAQLGGGTIDMVNGVMFTSASDKASSITQSGSGTINLYGDFTSADFTVNQTNGTINLYGKMDLVGTENSFGKNFDVESGAELTASSLSVGGKLTNDGTLTTSGKMTASGAVTNNKDMAVQSLEITGGTTTNAKDATLTAGSITVNGGTFENYGNITSANPSMLMTAEAEALAEANQVGLITIASGEMKQYGTTTSNILVQNGGTLTLGVVNGQTEPTSVGAVTLQDGANMVIAGDSKTGALTLEGGTITFELGASLTSDSVAGLNKVEITVNLSDAALNDIKNGNGFDYALFTNSTGASLAGTTVNFVSESGNTASATVKQDDNGKVTVGQLVPEPTTATLSLLALAALAARRRRR